MLTIKHEVVYLDERHLAVANEFADQRCKDTDLYRKRGGFKRIDIITGALGEMGVYKFLKLKGVKLSKPDFTIHDVKSKSYSADMQTDKLDNLHIKSQNMESAKLYGISYLMQKTDPVINKPGSKDYIVLTLVDIDKLKVTIYGIIKIKQIIKRKLLGEPKIEWLRKTKCAVYLEDLKVLPAKQRWRLLKN